MNVGVMSFQLVCHIHSVCVALSIFFHDVKEITPCFLMFMFLFFFFLVEKPSERENGSIPDATVAPECVVSILAAGFPAR